ncbi:MAG: hypothetical protein Q8L99_07035 [Polycyclovorans sp.]|nr:hypothetical protein [Polycyclovorans sp.]
MTDTSMMFMMPMPPTANDTSAIDASRAVSVRVLSALAVAISPRLRMVKSSVPPGAIRAALRQLGAGAHCL